jgi:hypothetical protein
MNEPMADGYQPSAKKFLEFEYAFYGSLFNSGIIRS